MKKMRKLIAFVLLICTVLTLLPPVQFAQAAEVTYELDTDGIDVGATYLVVRMSSSWLGTNIMALDSGNAEGVYTKLKESQLATGTIAYVDGFEALEWTVESSGDATNKHYLVHKEDDTNRYLDITTNTIHHTATPTPLLITPKANSNEHFVVYQKADGQYNYLFLNTSYCSSNSAASLSNINAAYSLRFYKKSGGETPTHSITYYGNGNTAGTLPENQPALEFGSSYTIPSPPEDFGKDGYLFSHWNTRADGNGVSYYPNDPITVEQDLELYAQWTLIPKYQVTVTTQLNDTNTDLPTMVTDAETLLVRLEGSDTELPLTKTTTGVYAAEVTENGTYCVYIQKSDGTYEDTGYTVQINSNNGAAELCYYTVSYNLNGGTLTQPVSTTVYPAGTKITAIQETPTIAGVEFLGWTDQRSNLIAPGETITESLQEETVLNAIWSQGQPTSYVIRYLEKGTYKELHQATTVEGSLVGTSVIAAQQVQAIEGYTYAGAGIGGQYYEKERDPYMTLSDDTTQNVMILFYTPDPDLHLHKEAILEDNGTYTIQLDMFTHNNPVTTLVDQNIPLDIVLVLDQSSSMYTGGVLDDLKDSVATFIDLVAEHGRTHETDHRIAIVGYGSGSDTMGGVGYGPVAGAYYDGQTVTNRNGYYTNTGVFDAHGDFHAYPITGFTYEKYEGEIREPEGADQDATAYYTYADGEYLLLTYHTVYRHMITESEAHTQLLGGTTIYGYVDGDFVALTRNSNGMWIYGGNQLYSSAEFFTRHEKVWTHRHGIEGREIHAYMVNGVFTPVDNHGDIYIRSETVSETPDKSIYRDALIPITMGAQGSGYVDFAFDEAVSNLGAKGQTYVSLGIEMANRIFAANPLEELNEETERQRIMVVFTDGKPGDSASFNETESNAALEKAAVAATEYGAQIYTIGLYGDTAADANADVERTKKDQEDFLLGLSSNYPNATKLEDVWQTVTYIPASTDFTLRHGGPYYVQVNENYYPLTQRIGEHLGNSVFEIYWYYEANGVITDVIKYQTNAVPAIGENGMMTNIDGNEITIYRKSGIGYKEADSHKYYLGAEKASELEQDFATIVRELTTKISTEVMMKDDTILRDIMGQGLVLTPNTVISVYKQDGTFIPGEKRVEWSDSKTLLDQLVIPENPTDTLYSDKSITVDGVEIPYISVYNLQSANPTDPTGDNYHPHTVDVTGYRYDEWYLNAGKVNGSRLVVTITRVEARDDVVWHRAQSTNNNQSGLWLPADESGSRELLEAFVEPSTIFVERAYVLDYGKEFTLSGWYFDDEDGKEATPIHLDLDIANGMNWFDPENPNTANVIDGAYGNTAYGNVQIKDGKVTYAPTTMNWGGYDQFYVFGNTWRNTVVSQDANENGNLWNKVTVIPANNIYYEDSFITTENTTQNGIEGFTFTGSWTVVGTGGDNTELPEHIESESYGEVHGWTDSLADDVTYTDGTAHATGLNKEMGAKAEFTFTGTGVEVYTRTNAKSGMVVAVLNKKALNGNGKETSTLAKSIAIDNLAVSGDYYHIPTVAFKDLEHGTYTLQLIATAASTATEDLRYEYYIDGVRIHNPLGNNANELSNVVTDAYELENNAVFTEVRDILLDYEDFNTDLPDSTDGKLGAVFIDWIQEGQGTGNDPVGTGVPTYEIGTFETYGPKNEVYLSAGQAIVLKVAAENTYFVGLKSLTGTAVTANISGINQADPTSISIAHSTDLYYQVTPLNGYIVIQNGSTDGGLLSITNLRTTNLNAPAQDGGILPVAQQEAVRMMSSFSAKLLENQNKPQPSTPTETGTALSPTENLLLLASNLFTSVRRWLTAI